MGLWHTKVKISLKIYVFYWGFSAVRSPAPRKYTRGPLKRLTPKCDVQPTLVISTLVNRIAAYLKEKILSLFKHRNQTSGNKILWIRGEIAPQEEFLPFSTIFSTYFLIKGVKLHVHLLNLVVRLIFSSILHI